MEKICKNCKHWGRSYGIDKFGNGVCDIIDIDESRANNKELAYIDVTVSDDSGLNVHFQTKENFGCVMFSEK